MPSVAATLARQTKRPPPGDHRRGRRARRVVVRDSREVIHGREGRRSRRDVRVVALVRAEENRRRPRALARHVGFVARARPHRRRGSVATEDDDSGGVRKEREVSPSRRARLSDVPRQRATTARQRSIGPTAGRVDHDRSAYPRRRRRTGATPRAKTNARLSPVGLRLREPDPTRGYLDACSNRYDPGGRCYLRRHQDVDAFAGDQKETRVVSRARVVPEGGSTSRASTSVSACSTRDYADAGRTSSGDVIERPARYDATTESIAAGTFAASDSGLSIVIDACILIDVVRLDVFDRRPRRADRRAEGAAARRWRLLRTTTSVSRRDDERRRVQARGANAASIATCFEYSTGVPADSNAGRPSGTG